MKRQRRVILTFDLLNPEVDHYIPLPRGPLVLICSKFNSFVFKISCSEVW